jgi:small subunit ribosomal protein S6
VQNYETLFIINPDLEESEITKTIEIVQDIIIKGGGTILKVDKWGKRLLAYQIQKKREGYYALIYFEAPATLIGELKRRYKLIDKIMRYLILRLKTNQMEEVLRTDSTKFQELPEPPSYKERYEQERENEAEEYQEREGELIDSETEEVETTEEVI